MAEFIMHVTKPGGRTAQIGDNDSGRFFKLGPSIVDVGGEPCEQHLDHRSTVAAINGLFDRDDFAAFAGPDFSVDTSVVSALAGGRKIASYLNPGDSPMAMCRTIDAGVGTKGDLTVIAETIIEPPDTNVMNDLATYAYPDFGLYIWRSERFFLSVRCGPVGQNGNGGHAHNDQLEIELNIDGEDWVADPGTYLYTPSPKDRDAYRSVHAHAAPKIGGGEPARLDLGLFRLEDKAQARCLSFDPDGFEGLHVGYGVPVHRRIELSAGRIRITDLAPASDRAEAHPVTVNDGKTLRKIWSLDLPFSPGYGLRD
ncbi:MAG: heparinase II/III-family protein [Rhodospirillales bacterium]|nr:heparinase II/III-family protein [Rhodospirillales bacterium]